MIFGSCVIFLFGIDGDLMGGLDRDLWIVWWICLKVFESKEGIVGWIGKCECLFLRVVFLILRYVIVVKLLFEWMIVFVFVLYGFIEW